MLPFFRNNPLNYSSAFYVSKKWDLQPTKRLLQWKEQPTQALLYNKTESESSFYGSQLIAKYLISKHNIPKILVQKDVYDSFYSLLKVQNNTPSLFEPAVKEAIMKQNFEEFNHLGHQHAPMSAEDSFFEEEILYQDKAKIVEMKTKLKLTLKDFERNFEFFDVSPETKRPSPAVLPQNDFIIALGGDGTVLHMHAQLFDCSAPYFPPILSFCAKKSLGFLLPHRLANFDTSIDRMLQSKSTATSRSRIVAECFREKKKNRKDDVKYIDVRGSVIESNSDAKNENSNQKSNKNKKNYDDIVHKGISIHDKLEDPVAVPDEIINGNSNDSSKNENLSENEIKEKLKYICINRHRSLNEVMIHRGNCTSPAVFLFSVCEEKKSNNKIFREGGGVYQISRNAKMYIKARGDGILVSSSTGSTGYNLSNQGAMVHPTLDCLCVTPINLNTPLSFRPTIFPTKAPNNEKIVVQVKILGPHPAILNYDCMHEETIQLQRGDLIQVKTDETPILTIDQEDSIYDWMRSVNRRFKYQL